MGYLVSHQGQEVGSFSYDEIVQKIRARELEVFDYIFDDTKQDWVLLMEHPEINLRLKSFKPPQPKKAVVQEEQALATAPFENTSAEVSVEASRLATMMSQPETATDSLPEWHLMKGGNKFGPFAYNDIVKMLQQKVVFPFDLVWNLSLPEWKRVAEVPEFSPETIRHLYMDATKKDVFQPRQFKRTKYNGRVILHDNLSLWKGQTFEISKGGVGVQLQNALIVPGQQIFAHFMGQAEWPAFNAVCEVVSKKFVNDGAPVEYGLRFLSLTPEVQDEFFKRVA